MPSSRCPPDMLRPVTDKSKRRQVGECCSLNLQSWRNTVKDCAAVRFISIERAEGVGVG